MNRPDHVAVPAHATDRVLCALMLVALAAPLLVTLALIVAGGREADDPKQGLSAWPAAPVSVKDAARWPTRFRRWFKDHYAGRKALIVAHGALLLRGLGASPSPSVLIGRDGWWFYTDDDAMEDIVSGAPMPEAAVDRWAATLEANRAWLAARGIAYAFVITPDKHVVYPEYLPATVRPLGHSRIAQIVEALRARTAVDVLDLRAPLEARKPVERVFHRTDTHWNARGAVTAHLAIVEWMARASPGLGTASREDFAFYEAEARGHDLPRMLGLQAIVAEHVLEARPGRPPRARVVEPAGADPAGEAARLVTEHPDASLPRVLVFRDSFMSALVPLLAEHCRRCVFLWQKDLDPEIVRQEQPDLVIHQMVGRRLQSYLPYDAVTGAER